MPNIEKILEDRKPNLEISFIKGGGPGGQNVNKRNSACQLIDRTDDKSPIVITVQEERSQVQNKVRALQIWEGKIRKMYYKQPERTNTRKKATKIKRKRDRIRLAIKKRVSEKKLRRKKVSDD